MSTQLPNAGFLRLPQVLQLFPVSRSQWWAGVRSGRFPHGVKLGPRTTAWRVEAIRDLIATMSGESDAAGPSVSDDSTQALTATAKPVATRKAGGSRS